MSQPLIGKSDDGIYPRCVWCRGENWMLAVIRYSHGAIPCAAAGGCGKFLPTSYITLPKASVND